MEKRIDKLDRNMSILMALLVEMKHVAATDKKGILKKASKKNFKKAVEKVFSGILK